MGECQPSSVDPSRDLPTAGSPSTSSRSFVAQRSVASPWLLLSGASAADPLCKPHLEWFFSRSGLNLGVKEFRVAFLVLRHPGQLESSMRILLGLGRRARSGRTL